ncbi:MAG TPA: glucose 1-dehydrogenase [Ktedonobacterales bacterium]|nr:glucose 1-dehydrogenase [Ktedonobacterales bacterium]
MMLANKVAIVTGGDSGIGHAISVGLASEGAAVTINYHRDQAAAEETLRHIQQAGGKGQVIQADVSSPADIQKLVDQTVRAFGRLDVMVNNAGMETRTSLLDTTERQFDLVIGVDLKSAFFGTQMAARQMIKQGGGGGHIINISSVHEDWPMPGNIAYCCAKGGVRMLTRTAGVELGPQGITVVNVGPGAVDTPIDAKTLADPAQKAKLDAAIPIGHVAEPNEIANLVVWLASDQARYGTATTYFIDGGIMQGSVGL